MRILLITGLTSYGVGGARAETVRLLRAIIDAGHIAALCADQLPHTAPPGIHHYTTDYPFRPKVAAQLARAIDEFKPDVVHAVGGGIRFLRAAETVLKGRPWALTIHNVPPAERIIPAFFDRPRLHRFARALITAPSVFAWSRFLTRKNAEVIVCHSRRVADEIRKAGHREAVDVIPLGCEVISAGQGRELPSYFADDAFPKLLSIGGLAPHKGQYELIRAIARATNSLPRLHCVSVGSHRSRRFRDFLTETTRRLKLSENIRFIGPADETTKRALLAEAEIYVQPSREEGFCLAFLEGAMVAAKLVGTSTGAIAEVAAQHRAAIVVPPGDVNALAEAIMRLANRPPPTLDELQKTREVLRATFSWTDHARRHLELYERLSARADHSSSEGTR